MQDRLIALYTALGRFNSDPNLGSVQIPEDGVERKRASNLSGYSDRVYIDEEKRGMDALARAFPNTNVLKFASWGPGNSELFEHAYKHGLGIGGPDLDPNPKAWTYGYPVNYQKYADKVPLHVSVQHPRDLTTVRTGTTIEQLFDYAVSDPPRGINLNFIIWDTPKTLN